MADIFISYTGSDRDWAFWLAKELEALGQAPRIHEWEIRGGDDIYAWMEQRLDAADHVLCVVSDDYLRAPYATLERNAALWQAASKRPGFVLFVVVKPCTLPTLSDHIRRCELFGIPEDAARLRFRDFMAARAMPAAAAFPGKVFAVSNSPNREPEHFLGRDDALAIERALARYEGRVAVTALHGLRGVGKTTLAAAYAERHRGDYRATWWIRAQTETTMRADLIALGIRLGWVGADDKEEPPFPFVSPINNTNGSAQLNAGEVESIGDVLRELGIAPNSFSWTPNAAGPYPGLRPLMEGDEAISFGRDIEIRDGLKALEVLRESVSQRALVMQAPSGAGKSSLLRAGLWGRLRNHAGFTPLGIVRAAKGVLRNEEWGLATALNDPRANCLNLSRDEIEVRVRDDLPGLLAEIADKDRGEGGRRTLLLGIDQAEEMTALSPAEDSELDDLLARLLKLPENLDLRLVLTARDDSVDATLDRLAWAGLRHEQVTTWRLGRLPATRFRDIVAGPAEAARRAGWPLRIDGALVDALAAAAASSLSDIRRWASSFTSGASVSSRRRSSRSRRGIGTRPAQAPGGKRGRPVYVAACDAHEREQIDKQRRIIGRAFVKPAMQAMEDGLSEQALRLAAAGALLARDPGFTLVPELWSPAARAMFASKTRAVLKGHSGAVIEVSFSPDGRRIVTASSDNTAGVGCGERHRDRALERP